MELQLHTRLNECCIIIKSQTIALLYCYIALFQEYFNLLYHTFFETPSMIVRTSAPQSKNAVSTSLITCRVLSFVMENS